MGDKKAIEAAKKGREAFKRWHSEHYYPLDLSGADLSRIDLRWVNFAGANLDDVDFTESTLTGSYFGPATFSTEQPFVSKDHIPASLRGTMFLGASLLAATFNYVELDGASFDGAYLGLVNFRGVEFNGISFSGARMLNTGFDNCRLAGAVGLESIRHLGPSHLDVQTLFHSPNLPLQFLRGVGLPDIIVNYFPDLVAAVEPISFYSCFISYSHADRADARLIHETLQARGIRCWLDEHQLLPGDDIYEVVDRAIRLWDKVLLCCSRESLKSWWVEKEIATVLEKEQQLCRERSKKILALVPLNLDGFMFSDQWQSGKASEIRTRLAADFTGWENDNEKFARELERIVKALRVDEGGRESPPKPKL